MQERRLAVPAHPVGGPLRGGVRRRQVGTVRLEVLQTRPLTEIRGDPSVGVLVLIPIPLSSQTNSNGSGNPW